MPKAVQAVGQKEEKPGNGPWPVTGPAGRRTCGIVRDSAKPCRLARPASSSPGGKRFEPSSSRGGGRLPARRSALSQSAQARQTSGTGQDGGEFLWGGGERIRFESESRVAKGIEVRQAPERRRPGKGSGAGNSGAKAEAKEAASRSRLLEAKQGHGAGKARKEALGAASRGNGRARRTGQGHGSRRSCAVKAPGV
jgi:hypothetical protein